MLFTFSMLVRLAWTGPPVPAHKLVMAGTPAQPRYAPLQFLFELGLIVLSWLLRRLTFPLKNVIDLQRKVKDLKKVKIVFQSCLILKILIFGS